MVRAFDHVIIAVADLDDATVAYGSLLGRQPSWRGAHPAFGTRNTLFRLDNTYLELLASDAGSVSPLADMVRTVLGDRAERALGLALSVEDIDAAVHTARARGLRVSDPAAGAGVDTMSGRERQWRSAFVDARSARGLHLILIQHISSAGALPHAVPAPDAAAVCTGVDHVVVFTADLDAATTLWTGVFGLREDWRHDFPERKTRNLGLNLGGITLELITRTDKPGKPETDKFWGIAYRVGDSERAAIRLRRNGIDIDAPRPGLLSGSRVATVRWPRTPTLLIEPAS